MRRENYTNLFTVKNQANLAKESFYVVSNDSGRNSVGQLVLSAQAYTLAHNWLTMVKPSGADKIWRPLDANQGMLPYPSVDEETTDKATERFYTQLARGRASLGMTLATYAQSRGMVLDRLRKMSSMFDGQLARNRRAGRRYRLSSGAGDVLEYNFGWVPLLSDVHSLCATAFAMAIPPYKATGRARAAKNFVWKQTGSPTIESNISVQYRSTVDAFISIENPNLWLLDRLGVINPAVVAWDAVPWSFVVNAFSNMNAVLSQHTNLVGLRVRNVSATHTARFLRENRFSNTGSVGWCDTNGAGVYKSRVPRTIPEIEFRGRIPDMDFTTCAIAASLLVQKLRRFTSWL